MYSCTILVPHVNTPYYLKTCIKQIKKYKHPLVDQTIFIADQSNEEIFNSIVDLYRKEPKVYILKLPRIDAGYPIDAGLMYADTDYFCSLDCDAFPIHENWLYLPIKLIDKYNLSFVGNNTGLAQSYKEKGDFFHINNYYRISRTSLAKEISEAVGFMRVDNRYKAGFIPKDDAWGTFPCDNGVAAQWYADQKKMGSKISLKITSYLGKTNKMGIYGMVIDDLVYHNVFGFGEEWISDMKDVLGDEYLSLKNMIIKKGFLSDKDIRTLISKSARHDSIRLMDNKSLPSEVDAFINHLKNEKSPHEVRKPYQQKKSNRHPKVRIIEPLKHRINTESSDSGDTQNVVCSNTEWERDLYLPLLQTGFFDYLPDQIVTPFENNYFAYRFFKYLDEEQPDFKAKLAQAVQKWGLTMTFDEAVKNQFIEAVSNFIKS